MRFGVIVSKGFEKVAVEHIRELTGSKNIHVHSTIVIFETNDWEKAYAFVYMNQIAHRVLYIIDEIDYTTDEDLLSKISQAVPKDEVLDQIVQLNSNKSDIDFRCSVSTDIEVDNASIESEIGGVIIDYAKIKNSEIKVNLKNPILNIYVYMYNSQAFLGIDLSGDLSKRDYKIFNNAVSLKGPSAFGLLMAAEYNPEESYINPSCYSGTIEIEAALYATKTSHRFYNKNFPFMKLADKIFGTSDKYWESFYKKIDARRSLEKYPITGSDKLLSSITAAGKNAKIAGIMDSINFRRVDTDWMDIKYEELSIDKIITFIPGSSKHQDLAKEFKQLFYQAEYILKNKSLMVIMCLSKDLLIESSKEYFKLHKELEVQSGQQKMYILFFKKIKNSSKNKDEDGD